MQRIILLVVRSSTVAIVVGRVARVYSSSGEYLSLAPSSGELLAREALLLVTGPVLELALMGIVLVSPATLLPHIREHWQRRP